MILTLITSKPPEIRGSIMGRRLLSLSYRHTLLALLWAEATGHDLATGLFYFRCTRNFFFQEGSAAAEFARANLARLPSVDTMERISEQLQAAVLLAEAQGRAAWRPHEHAMSSYAMVNKLLSDNGIEPLQLPADSGPNYDAHEVARIVKGVGREDLLVIPSPRPEA